MIISVITISMSLLYHLIVEIYKVEYLVSYYRPFTTTGLILISLGLLFVLIPILARYLPSIENVPWYIIWVYKRDGFYFATSPLLVVISIISIVVSLLSHRGNV